MALIDRKTIDQVYQAVNILDVVGDFVTLKKAGANYKGLCPFHDEKTPSFIVTPSRGICHCFGCHKGGNAVNFLMQLNNWTYPEAIRYLAKKYNIDIIETESSEQARQEQRHREELFTLNEWANQYFQRQLHDTAEGQGIGLSYFRSRGFRDDIIRKFQLGYCPSKNRAMVAEATANHLSIDNLVETGLAIRPETGDPFDRFHGRVMFPVHNHMGKVVAFGGRILEKRENTGKYVNSPESPIYSKSRELYGIFFARLAIQKADCCYMVEGYTDVISMHQCGIENVVASSGTALTHDQIRLVKKFTTNLTVLYDGDSAGIKASLRGIDMLLEHGFNIKVLLLPDGDDPDSFARKHEAQEYVQYINDHQVDFIRFKINLLLSEAGNDIHSRSQVINNIAQSIARIDNTITRSLYIQECATLTRVREQDILETVNSVRNQQKLQKLQEHQKAVSQQENDSKPQDLEAPTPAENPLPRNIETSKPRTAQSSAETNLMKYVIRFGEQELGKFQTEDGTEVSLTFASYIKEALAADDIELENSLYATMLDEITGNQHKPAFSAANYLLSHPDDQIRDLALRFSSDREQAIAVSENSITAHLSETADKLLRDLAIAILEDKITENHRLITSDTLTDEEVFQKLKEIQDFKQAQNLLKKK